MKALNDKVLAILTPDQKSRVHEIAIQIAGNSAVLDQQIGKSVKLGDEQKDQIKSLVQKLGEANRSIMDKAREGAIERDEVRSLIRKNGKTLNVEIGKILSDDQKSQLKTLAGKPFAAQDDEQA